MNRTFFNTFSRYLNLNVGRLNSPWVDCPRRLKGVCVGDCVHDCHTRRMVMVMACCAPRNYGEGATNVRLSNCEISSVAGLGRLLTSLQRHRITSVLGNLTWLDLSFNTIATLSTDTGAVTGLKGLR